MPRRSAYRFAGPVAIRGSAVNPLSSEFRFALLQTLTLFGNEKRIRLQFSWRHWDGAGMVKVKQGEWTGLSGHQPDSPACSGGRSLLHDLGPGRLTDPPGNCPTVTRWDRGTGEVVPGHRVTVGQLPDSGAETAFLATNDGPDARAAQRRPGAEHQS